MLITDWTHRCYYRLLSSLVDSSGFNTWLVEFYCLLTYDQIISIHVTDSVRMHDYGPRRNKLRKYNCSIVVHFSFSDRYTSQ